MRNVNLYVNEKCTPFSDDPVFLSSVFFRVLYQVPQTTPIPSPLLSSMFSGKHELRPEADGSYFIDRDGTHFRHILNYLRDADLDLDTSSNSRHLYTTRITA